MPELIKVCFKHHRRLVSTTLHGFPDPIDYCEECLMEKIAAVKEPVVIPMNSTLKWLPQPPCKP